MMEKIIHEMGPRARINSFHSMLYPAKRYSFNHIDWWKWTDKYCLLEVFIDLGFQSRIQWF